MDWSEIDRRLEHCDWLVELIEHEYHHNDGTMTQEVEGALTNLANMLPALRLSVAFALSALGMNADRETLLRDWPGYFESDGLTPRHTWALNDGEVRAYVPAVGFLKGAVNACKEIEVHLTRREEDQAQREVEKEVRASEARLADAANGRRWTWITQATTAGFALIGSLVATLAAGATPVFLGVVRSCAGGGAGEPVAWSRRLEVDLPESMSFVDYEFEATCTPAVDGVSWTAGAQHVEVFATAAAPVGATLCCGVVGEAVRDGVDPETLESIPSCVRTGDTSTEVGAIRIR